MCWRCAIPNYLDQFLASIEPWKFSYRRVVRTYFAFVTETECVLRHGLIALVPEVEQLNLAPISIRTKRLIAGREIVEVTLNDLDRILDQIVDDPLVLHASELKLPVGGGEPKMPHFTYYPTNHPRFQGPMRIPGLVIRHGFLPGKFTPEIPQIDLELGANGEPFGGVVDVVQSLGLPQDVLADDYRPSIEIVAAPPAAITNASRILDGTASVEVRCSPGTLRERLRVGLRGFTRDQANILRITIGPEQFSWSNIDNFDVASASVKVGEVSLAQLFLVYGDEPIFTYYISDPNRSFNRAYDLYTLIDDKRALPSSLGTMRGNDFQSLVALYLQLIGLSVLNFGTLFNDGPDLLVTSNANDLYVLECSAGDPDNKGKLLKLHLRTKYIRDACQIRGIAFRHIQPVIVTNLPKSDTAASWGKTAGFGIALVCREQLEQIFTRAPTPPTADQIHEAVMACIPTQENLDAKLF
jgi:hypothetical protein